MMKCGLLGEKLGHSYSPQIHSMFSDYEYILYEKTPSQVEEFVKEGSWNGLNVTIPYKKTVIPFCDILSDVALATGSVNTLVKTKDGVIFGDNTDAFGFSCLLKKNNINPQRKKTLVLGNGGACASVKNVLEANGASVTVISRSGPDNYANLAKHEDAALIVNTTPVGMYPENGISPIGLGVFSNLSAVIDIIYNPFRTALMLQAENMGILMDNGLYMLCAQAYESSRRFELSVSARGENDFRKQGRVTDQGNEIINKVYNKLAGEMNNIILIGMPGSGKSSVARELGKMTGRTVADLDRAFLEKYGTEPGKFILEHGEEKFRQLETEIVREYGKKSGQIISTGGGCVTRPENYPLLHQNGRIAWIKRDVCKLETTGRPISIAAGNDELFRKRKSLYESFADISVDNVGSVKETAMEVLRQSDRFFCQP